MEKITIPSPYSITRVVFLLASIGFGLLVLSCIVDLSDIRGVESNVVYTLQLTLKDNTMLYPAPEALPYNVTMYSPLYYLVGDGLLSLFNIDSPDFYSIRIITRLLSVLVLILSLLSLRSLLVKGLSVDKSTSNILCLLFFICTFPWYNISRPDVFALWFLVLAINSVVSYLLNIDQRKHAALLGIYIFLGFATKLTMAVYVLPIGLYLLFTRNWKIIFIAALSFTISLVLFYLVMLVGNYDLTFIKKNIIDSINNGYDLAMAMEKVYSYFFARLAIFTMGVILLCVGIFRNWKQEKNDPVLMFLTTITFFIFSLSFMMCLKAGSAENYFNEPILCMILLSAYILEKRYAGFKQLYVICFMIFGIAVAGGNAIKYKSLSNKYLHLSVFFHQDRSQQAAEFNAIKAYLATNLGDSYFFSENREVAMSFPFQCVMFPGDIHEITYRRNVYNYKPFQDWVRNDRQCKYLVVAPQTESLYGIKISDLYTLKEKFAYYYLYELAEK